MASIAGLGPPEYELPFYRHVTKIVNSEGRSWAPIGANIQEAIDDLPDAGGTVYLPRDELFIEDVVVVSHPIYIKGAGMTWHGTEGGTCITSLAGLAGENMFEFYNAGGLIPFAGMSDLTLYNLHGRDGIRVLGLSDAYFERLYINHGDLNGIYVEGSEFGMWNLWIRDCLLENMSGAGVRIDPADHAIIKTHILDNYFYACDLGIVLQRVVDTGGVCSAFTIKGNHIYDTRKTGVQLWKVCDHIDVSDNILHNIGTDVVNTSNAIRVGDGNVAGDKCQWIKILGNIVNGNAVTKYGVSLEDFADRILVLGNTVHGCATAPYNAEVGVTNVEHAHNIEV